MGISVSHTLSTSGGKVPENGLPDVDFNLFFKFASEVIEISVCDSWVTSQVGPGAQHREHSIFELHRGPIDTADQLAVNVKRAAACSAAGRRRQKRKPTVSSDSSHHVAIRLTVTRLRQQVMVDIARRCSWPGVRRNRRAGDWLSFGTNT